MNPSSLTVDEVRNELTKLIEEFPDRNGKAHIEDSHEFEDGTCVYYLDKDDMPISMTNYDVYHNSEVQFATPVCIIGQWIETFHPEFKQNDLIREVLLKNSVLSNTNVAETPFSQEVLTVLATAQTLQDQENARWSDIKLDAL